MEQISEITVPIIEKARGRVIDNKVRKIDRS